MGAFNNPNMSLDPRMEKSALQNKYNSSRMNLLTVVGFTAVNLFMLTLGGGSYFLFSATIPYLLTLLSMLFCGMMPEDVYAEMGGVEAVVFLDESVFYIALGISAAILALYLLCWVFSKKSPLWLIVALVLFAIDTLVMFLYYGLDIDIIIDIVFHGWIIWILLSGIIASAKLKKLPAEEPVIEAEFAEMPVNDAVTENTAAKESIAAKENAAEAKEEIFEEK